MEKKVQFQEYVDTFQYNEQQQYQQEIIEEREIEIKKINEKAIGLNEIMKDLSILVSDQGIPIVEIKNNIEESKEKTKNGLSQLQLVDKRQHEETFCQFLCIIS